MKRPAASLLAAAALVAATALHGETHRTYHDDVTRLADSTLVISFPEADSVNSQALELRASLPKAGINSSRPSVSVIWDVAPDRSSYYRATLRPVHPSADDIVDSRYVEFTVVRHTPQADSLIVTAKLDDGFGLGSEENSLGVVIDRPTATACVYGGHERPKRLAELKTASPLHPDMGLQAVSEADISLLVSEYTVDEASRLHTAWTPEALAARLADARAPEGFYRYLDRKTDRRYCKLGGNYTLALVASADRPGAYDIIYVDGADILPGQWTTGMLKGRLTPTIFDNHFDLQWFGSSTRAVADECNAFLEQGAILRLEFPLLKSSVRFVRTAPLPE